MLLPWYLFILIACTLMLINAKAVLFLVFGTQQPSEVNMVKTEIESFYHVKISDVRYANLPRKAYEPVHNRYKAKVLLDYLINEYPNHHVFAMTSKDIAISKHGNYDWGIMGYSTLGNGASVVSSHRINRRDLHIKIALHEFGHAKGLSHCNSGLPCLMKDAKGKGRTINRQPKALCRKCVYKLKSSTEYESTYLHPSVFPNFFRFISDLFIRWSNLDIIS